MKLYQIEDQIAVILEGTVNEETGEVTIDYSKLEELEGAKTQKIENIIRYYKNTIGDAEKFDAEIKNLSARKKTLENKANSLKNFLDMLHNGNKAEYGVHKITYRKSSKLKDGDINLLPEAFTNMTITANKADIKEYLKSGKKLEGWEIVEKQNIQFK